MLSPLIAHFELAGRLPLLILYLILNLMAYPLLPKSTAQPPLLWHLFGNGGQELARRLNKRGLPEKDIFSRGRIFIFIMLLLAGLIGAAVLKLMHYPYGWLMQVLLLAGCINALLPVALLRRTIKDTDQETKRRQDIMNAADHFARTVVAPVFYFMVGGPLALMIVVALLSAIEMKRLSVEGAAVFFYAPLRRLNRLLMIIPNLIAVMLICLAGLFVSGGNMFGGIRMLKGIRWHDSFGVVIAVTAGVLGVTLGGPVNEISGDVFMRNWIGPKGSSARITERDRNRAALLFTACFILIIGVLSLVLIMKNLLS